MRSQIHARAKRRALFTPPLVMAFIIAGCACWIDGAAAEGRSFGWKATSPQGVMYLVGSVHLLTADYYPLAPALDAAYKDSSLLVEEVDMGDMLSPDAQLQMLMRGRLPSGQSLDTVVTPSTMTMVEKTVADLRLPLAPLRQFKPWMLSLQLLALEWQKAGFNADLGLDKHFYDRAKADGKAVQGLETPDYQIGLFDGMSMEQQDHMLSESLKELATEEASVNTLAKAWKSGDAPAIERIVLDDLTSDPAMYQRLLVDRNRAWFPKIDALLNRSGHAFVLVGAAHLVGPDGLLRMLEAKGYTVEQM